MRRFAAAVALCAAAWVATTAPAGAATGAPCRPAGQVVSVVPEGCWGRFPSSHYDIGYDEGAWDNVSRKVYGTLTDVAFQWGRTATGLALWMVGWAYGFGVFARLGPAAEQVASAYQRGLVGPLGLIHLAWLYAVVWAAVAGLRGRLTMAAGELALSVVLAGLGGVVVAHPGMYLEGTFDTMGRLSAAALAAGSGQAPPASSSEADRVVRPLQDDIEAAFVEVPYDYLDWGAPLRGACAAARDQILASGPHGADDGPRQVMSAAGCGPQAAFNHDPDGNRLFGAVLTAMAATVMAALVALVALTVVVAQILVVVLFAVAPLALVGAVLPGAGRELAWRWLSSLLRAVIGVVGMSFVLCLLLLTVSALLRWSDDVGLVERFTLVNTAVVAMFVARRRILAAGHGMAASFGHRLAARRVGGERAAPWLAAPAAAGATGFALASAVGPDRASRTSRLASAGGRNYLANRRLRRSQESADARSVARVSATVARERTEIAADARGTPVRRTVVTVDGPVPATRRGRAARARLEDQSGRQVVARRHAQLGTWRSDSVADGGDDGTDQEVVDVEGA